MTQYLDLSIAQLAAKLRQGEITVAELVAEAYQNIEKSNPRLNALVTVVDQQTALDQAKKSQEMLKTSDNVLCGLPYVLKDSYVTEGIKTTAASKILENYIPVYNATVYNKLKQAGAILVGKANMDAWGHGATSENTDFGPVKNPWDLTRVAGGSSGGCGAAVAAGMASFAIGEDTGGSIRNPSSWCNVTGLKVTYGRVSRYGCIAYASSFDTVGPMAKSAKDCAQVLAVIAGEDAYDASSAQKQVPNYAKLLETKQQVSIGVPKELINDTIKPQVKKGIEKLITTLEEQGHKIISVSMPTLEYALSVYYLIAPSETSSNLARYDGVRYGGTRDLFRPENKRRIMIGSYALSAGYYDAYYKKALQARTLLINEYEKAFKQADILLMPVTTSVATKLGEKIDDPIENMLLDLFTTSQNPVGIPSLAIPAGFGEEGMPFGVQLVGPKFSETTLFNVAHHYQQENPWHTRKPAAKKVE